jgi:hypothetical protein
MNFEMMMARQIRAGCAAEWCCGLQVFLLS